ncbi:MAG: DUF2207 domain-containing protein [Firmicutes bacterium]|nr:DUF2207 domain-containing protein [Bacillota bacterium]
MKNNFNKIVLLVIMSIFLTLSNTLNVHALDDEYIDYTINKYDVKMIINENNTLDITETITAYFNVAKHGIFRTIPMKNTIKRLDGSTSTNHAQIFNVDVNNKYKLSRENGNYKIKIGSEDETLTGEQNYIIKYTYNLGKDPLKDVDELYYNIIGTEWDTTIDNITFTVIMPKEFDSSKLGFSSGKIGSTDNNIIYNVNENEITGSYIGTLEPSEGITIRCELPEGYFVGAKYITSPMDYITLLVPIVFLIIVIIIWYKYGRDEKVIETVEFYPPEGLNSLDTAFLYKGNVEDTDVVSLLIYLANKGYLEIEDTVEDKFTLRKLKEYDGTNENEKLFIEGIFKGDKKEVTNKDLKNKFYKTIDKITGNINTKENKSKIFEQIAASKIFTIVVMIIIAHCLVNGYPIYTYFGDIESLIVLVIFQGFIFFFIIGLILNLKKTREKKISIIVVLSLSVFLSFTIIPVIMLGIFYIVNYSVGILCIVGMSICLYNISKRTKYGNEMLGKIRGFKNFLETAEKEKLESYVNQNPNYFYDILPYTYVLEISDTWIKKFETISIQKPDWYRSSNNFNVSNFASSINDTMTSVESTMTSVPSSGSGGSGGSSGGGFSGGGSGGGGGGSW